MKTGIELITEERQKQITKHGFTAEHHANHSEWYEKNQLLYAARFLLTGGIEDIDKQLIEAPIGWNKDWFYDLTQRSEDERLVIAGALIAAEIDRREYLKKHSK